jgi:NADH:ubiquinone oxidoreductase subunit 6 (subunit J)
MLINIQLSQIKTYNINNGIPIGLSIGISFWLMLYFLIKDQINDWNSSYTELNMQTYNNINLDKALSNIWDVNIFDVGQISSLGHIMYGSYFIWFIYVSLILLLAMIGAIQLTLKN